MIFLLLLLPGTNGTLDISITLIAISALLGLLQPGRNDLRQVSSNSSCMILIFLFFIYFSDVRSLFVDRDQSNKAFLLEVKADDMNDVDIAALEAEALAQKDLETPLVPSASTSMIASTTSGSVHTSAPAATSSVASTSSATLAA